MDKFKDKKILDMGCGLGNFFKRLENSNKFVGIDGADINESDKLCNFDLHQIELNSPFSHWIDTKDFDIVVCSEVLEHLTNPYNALHEAKKLAKVDATFILSVPSLECWHNYIYPGLMSSRESFEQFLGQMALKIEDYAYWDKGWQCHCWKLLNRPYSESKMLFPKAESKFRGKSPLEYVNL